MPFPIPGSLMTRIMSRCDPFGQVHRRLTEPEARKRFNVGDKVRVHDLGDARSFLATVRRELGNERYLVELERALLGKDVVEISAADVREVNRAS